MGRRNNYAKHRPAKSKYSKRRRARRLRKMRVELTPREHAAKIAAGKRRRRAARKERLNAYKSEFDRRNATNETPHDGSVSQVER